MSDRKPLIVAHRGASHDAPENTLAAFRLAFEQGADAIEGDFHLTADGEVACIHDGRTGRCGDRDLAVAENPLALLREVDVGAWKSPRFVGERVPTLREVLAVVPPGKGMFIELKSGPAIVLAVRAAIETSAVPASSLRVISFDAATIAVCRSAMPTIATTWLTGYRREREGGWSPQVDSILATLAGCGGDSLGTAANLDVATPAFARTIREAGYGLHVWTVDDLVIADAFRALGVASITTNRPALFSRE